MRYLIDTDVFRETFWSLTVDDVTALLNRMHEASTSLFQHVITADYYTELQQS